MDRKNKRRMLMIAMVVLLLLALLVVFFSLNKGVSTGQALAYNLGDGSLVAQWTFDEGSGVAARDSMAANHLQLGTGDCAFGKCPTWVAGPNPFGTALSFDGVDDYAARFNFPVFVDTGFSIAFRVRPIALASSPYKTPFYFQAGADGTISLRLSAKDSIIKLGSQSIYSSPLLADQWSFVVLTYDKATNKVDVYVNGEKKTTYTLPAGAFVPKSGTLFFGSWAGTAAFQGLIDEAAIYKKRLDQRTVRLLMCGDAIVQSWSDGGREQCDDGNQRNGDGCTNSCFKEIVCGNGIINAPEQCDGTNLAGQTCQSVGYGGGNLACFSVGGMVPGCTFNTAGCFYDADGDGVADSRDRCPGTFSGTPVLSTGCPDADHDGVAEDDGDGTVDFCIVGSVDCDDNCQSMGNPGQPNYDLDAFGDACDADDDDDGVVDTADVCPLGAKGWISVSDSASLGFSDFEGDGCQDSGEDNDDDNDGVVDGADVDPLNPDRCTDSENSGGDGCDDCAIGTDGVGVLSDNRPEADGDDFDNDRLCDTGDSDADGDGSNAAASGGTDCNDRNPAIHPEAGEVCDDGIDNNCQDGRDGSDPLCADFDADKDGVASRVDSAPSDPTICADADGDGCDDCSVGTDQGGPLPDNDPAHDGADLDRDGLCDAGDDDTDNDGVANAADADARDVQRCEDSDADGCDDCSLGKGDGIGVLSDSRPADDGPDRDGDNACDVGDDDDDGDGIGDDADSCALGITGWSSDGVTDTDGDGCKDDTIEDADDDNDRVLDTGDACGETMVGVLADAGGCSCSQKSCDDGNICTLDTCNGVTVACEHTPKAPDTECRAAVSVCDAVEYCAEGVCPDDSFKTNDAVCRSVLESKPADRPEYCDGTSSCPVDISCNVGEVWWGTECGTPPGTEGARCSSDEECTADDGIACTKNICQDRRCRQVFTDADGDGVNSCDGNGDGSPDDCDEASEVAGRRASGFAELCDGIDNDCDYDPLLDTNGDFVDDTDVTKGKDEGYTANSCQSLCSLTFTWTGATCCGNDPGEVYGVEEAGTTCADGVDNDCDGGADSGDAGCAVPDAVPPNAATPEKKGRLRLGIAPECTVNCDDGNLCTVDSCSGSTCFNQLDRTISGCGITGGACGDGVVNNGDGEQCDDRNTRDGTCSNDPMRGCSADSDCMVGTAGGTCQLDGCSADCQTYMCYVSFEYQADKILESLPDNPTPLQKIQFIAELGRQVKRSFS